MTIPLPAAMAPAPRQSSIVATASWKDHKPPQIVRKPVHTSSYPRASRSFIGSIHDIRCASGLVHNNHNFSRTTKAIVYETTQTEQPKKLELDETSGSKYLQDIAQNQGPEAPMLRVMYDILLSLISPPPDCANTRSFCYLESAKASEQTNFRCKVSLSANFAKQLLMTFDVTPQFSGALLGQPDYGAPGDFASFDRDGNIETIEFCCQQPRWAIHNKLTPWCIYMTHTFETNSTTYIIVCDEKQSRLDIVQQRLDDILTADRRIWASLSDSLNPYFLHLLITQEVFLDAAPEITKLRHNLYGALDRVDSYAEKDASEREKKELEDLTIKLHVVSQETDRMSANVGMSSMILQCLMRAHDRFRGLVATDNSMKDAVVRMDDALQYMFESIESQQRWLSSYKSRKDIAMNLVFNLVTQQDSSTSTTIAREAKADGSAMRTIATLTMLFLPGTFVSSVFSMPMLEGAHWRLYIAITIPLTLLVFITWWVWQSYETWMNASGRVGRRARGKRIFDSSRP